jgi:metal-responsive CopG/Arc/MetJ family transcriptional regulator
MQQMLTITVPEEIRLALDDETQREGISPSDLIGKALREYLFFRRFRLLRERMIPKAQAQGIYTDQDVFDRVS